MNSTRMRGKKGTPHRDPDDPPRQRANRRRGHGTDAHDRPPLISIVNRQRGERRIWVCAHADRSTCHGLQEETGPPTATLLASDEWRADTGAHLNHRTAAHTLGEWARDADGDVGTFSTHEPLKNRQFPYYKECDYEHSKLQRPDVAVAKAAIDNHYLK